LPANQIIFLIYFFITNERKSLNKSSKLKYLI
jgi:hypothetical protein